MKLVINTGNELFRESQQKTSATGSRVRGSTAPSRTVRKTWTPTFAEKRPSPPRVSRQRLLALETLHRGESLQLLRDGEFLFYSDSGCHFIASLDPLFEICDRDRLDVLSFEIPFLERDWTKRDAFLLLDCDRPEFTRTRQRLSGYSLWRKSAFAVALAREWLEAIQDPRLVTDRWNTLGQPNYAGFREHRHDQSIFSLLTKKHGLPAYRDPSQFGNDSREEYPASTYGWLIDLTRKRSRLPLLGRVAREARRATRFVLSPWSALRARGVA